MRVVEAEEATSTSHASRSHPKNQQDKRRIKRSARGDGPRDGPGRSSSDAAVDSEVKHLREEAAVARQKMAEQRQRLQNIISDLEGEGA